MRDILKKLDSKRNQAILGGGKNRQDSQHKKGKLALKEKELRFYLIKEHLKNGTCL